MNIIFDGYLVQISYPRKIDDRLWTSYTRISLRESDATLTAFRSFGESRKEAGVSAYSKAKQRIITMVE